MSSDEMPEVTDDELMMNVTLVIAPECRDEYLDALREVLPKACSEPACLLLEVGEVADVPGTFVLCERWRSGTEYLNQVLQLPYFRRYLERTEPLYAAPRSVVVAVPIS